MICAHSNAAFCGITLISYFSLLCPFLCSLITDTSFTVFGGWWPNFACSLFMTFTWLWGHFCRGTAWHPSAVGSFLVSCTVTETAAAAVRVVGLWVNLQPAAGVGVAYTCRPGTVQQQFEMTLGRHLLAGISGLRYKTAAAGQSVSCNICRLTRCDLCLFNHVLNVKWWGAGVSICLKQGADLYMAQLMPLPLTVSLASVKSRLVLPFWYLLTRVVPDKGSLNGCVCVCKC